jgi:hypothetical protein
MTPQLYIDAVLKLESQKKVYDKINNSIADAQNDSDFATRLEPIDNYLEDIFVKALDDALFSLTGFGEMASYHLYESRNSWFIKDVDGTEYKWSDGEGFAKVVYAMMKTKPNHKYAEINL